MNKTLALIAALGLVVAAPAFAAPAGDDTAVTPAAPAGSAAETAPTKKEIKSKQAKEEKAKNLAKEAPTAQGNEAPASK